MLFKPRKRVTKKRLSLANEAKDLDEVTASAVLKQMML